ncbi:MAG: hypothetical protein WDO15_24525 [Bacteroidota bacterium]
MNRQQIKELVPLALLVAALIYTTIVVSTTDRALTFQHWLGYSLTAFVLVTFLLNRTLSKIILSVTVILGVLNVVAFTPTIWIVGGGITLNAFDSDLTIGIQLFSFLVFLSLIYAYRKQFSAWINKDGL